MAKQIHARNDTYKSIIDFLANFIVDEKPKIQPLGNPPKRRRSFSTSRVVSNDDFKKTSFSGRRIKPAKRLLHDEDTSPKNSSHQRIKRLKTPVYSNNLSNSNAPDNDILLSSQGGKPNSNFDSTIQHQSKNMSQNYCNERDITPPLILESSVNYETKPKMFSLRKQKILSMYRDPKKIYYYNKVVTPVNTSSLSNIKSNFYFVLNYDEENQIIRIIPLYTKGTFKGKREGCTKWKARVQERTHPLDPLDVHGEKMYFDSMDIITVPCADWKIVQASMVTKCAGVKEESWDLHI
eukprot:CAMPEP_0197842892 /NCGR_PEP_ID=MMETSP1437-20131217/47003_1 /TAXON_ID=49252 ORGANISM="Eucampia antarctica, Strain CCMP1452" /NCGR_SAMPLE_ID=MMETSP1437 /ASSEMBLY_ACC=CAM_ASM_001096 /LENGTH=293 /DNA_ID=CAMNT_0043452841 /DNA_START=24 /DNA_END=905 /DNA_ORIENTATION=+